MNSERIAYEPPMLSEVMNVTFVEGASGDDAASGFIFGVPNPGELEEDYEEE